MTAKVKKFWTLICAFFAFVALGFLALGTTQKKDTVHNAEAASAAMVGIDVSAWQQTIDWAQVKASGVQFAMLRSYASSLDTYFDANVKGATAQGIAIGTYVYSYANTVAEAQAQANTLVNLLNSYAPGTFTMPIVFDAESSNVRPIAASACDAFCQVISDAGYYPMIYANSNWFNNVITPISAVGDIDFWQANYYTAYAGVTPSGLAALAEYRPSINSYDGNVTIWQCTDGGRVPGISGNVDMNVCYVDYPTIIKQGGFNGCQSNMSAEESDTYYPGNAQNIGFPVDNHPNIKLTGLSMTGVKCYWGLEDYGDNANLILINGKTVAQWQAEKPLSVARAWIFGNGNNCTCWFGFHLDDVNALRLDTQAGTGEVLQTITLKKGLKILQTAQDIWGSDNVITETSGNVTGIAGTVEYDITLTAKSGGGFSVAVAEPETKTYVEVTGDGVNVRSEPSAEQGTATVLGVANQGEQYEYLGEQTGAWYKILYQGQTAYITSDYSKLVEVEVGTGDSGNTDGGDTDSGNTDSGNTDSGNTDSGNTDSGNTDSGNTDSGNTDSGNTDSGNTDSGNTDSGNTDSGNTDGGNTGDVDNVGGDVGNNNGNEDVPTTNGGCGGSMGGMALGVLVFAGAALLLKKRKQN